MKFIDELRNMTGPNPEIIITELKHAMKGVVRSNLNTQFNTPKMKSEANWISIDAFIFNVPGVKEWLESEGFEIEHIDQLGRKKQYIIRW